MSDSPISAPTPLPASAGRGWPWAPGVRLMRRLDRGGRWTLLLLASLLPLAWLLPRVAGMADITGITGITGIAGIDRLPPAAAALLALPGLYLWACAWLARRDRPAAAAGVEPLPRPGGASAHGDAGTGAPVSGEAAVGTPVPGDAAICTPVRADAGPEVVAPARADADAEVGEAARAPAGAAGGDSVPAPVEVRADLPMPTPEPPEPGRDAPVRAEAPEAAAAGLRTCHAEIRMATDEIARRTVALAGMLDACSQAMESAVADLDALQDEERVVQKVLVTLRARLLALDHRNHALMRTALAGPPAADDPGALVKAVQVAEAQVLHCHQLSERLGAAERGAARHVESLRRVAELLSHHAQRGLRESQQVMVLTRKVGASLAAAEAQAAADAGRSLPPPT